MSGSFIGVDKFLCGAMKTRLTLLLIYILSVVSAVYRNRIVMNNIIKLQDINCMFAFMLVWKELSKCLDDVWSECLVER
jgi:hypothetical protein